MRRGRGIYTRASLFILHTLHPALEDGTDRGFRNVGKPQSDAGEIPKRIHTKHHIYSIHADLNFANCLANYTFMIISLVLFEWKSDDEMEFRSVPSTLNKIVSTGLIPNSKFMALQLAAVLT